MKGLDYWEKSGEILGGMSDRIRKEYKVVCREENLSIDEARLLGYMLKDRIAHITAREIIRMGCSHQGQERMEKESVVAMGSILTKAYNDIRINSHVGEHAEVLSVIGKEIEKLGEK